MAFVSPFSKDASAAPIKLIAKNVNMDIILAHTDFVTLVLLPFLDASNALIKVPVFSVKEDTI